MGGTTFDHYARGVDVKQAFIEAREQASFEHGHAGYTGTIAEKHDYVVITRTPMLSTEAYQLAHKLIDEDDQRITDKWGPAGAIPVIDGGKGRTATVTVTVPGGLTWQEQENLVRVEAKRLLKLKAGERFVGVTQANVVKKGRVKVSASVPKEKAVTRYTISGTHHSRWETGFDTQAKARAAAVEIAGRDLNFVADVTTYDIEAITRRADGRPLVSVTRSLTTKTLEVSVEVAQGQPKTTPDGWLFFGWASC